MVRDIDFGDLNRVNEILQCFNFKIDDQVFNKEFMNVVVYDDAGIKGVVVYDLIYDRIEIEYIVVEASSRRNGIATSMIDYIENKHPNIKNITLEVRESNAGAIEFYEKLGFRRVSIRKNYYNNENGILMIKLGE